jgi:F-type H+/Na+-transporting ATPase subunit alpha
VGNVLQVSDGVARIYGLRNAEANELLEFENGIMAIVMNLEEEHGWKTVRYGIFFH